MTTVAETGALPPPLVVGFDLDSTLVDLSGTHSALAAVRRQRGCNLVVKTTNAADAALHVAHLDLDVDRVRGTARHAGGGGGKAALLVEEAATIYVGNHVQDMAAALTAGAVSVGVTTGAFSRGQLTDAGADIVLSSLSEFPDWLDEHLLGVRLSDLCARLEALDSLLVAFSGGADSAFLLAAAVRVLGADRVMAATAHSDSLPMAERGPAAAFCAELGVRQLTPQTAEMDRAGYRANGGDRCYFCKSELIEVLAPVARDHGLSAVATGTNADDAVAGFRPGIRAAAERGALTPLRDAGLTKAQVREASRRWGLSTWDKPAAACLSSRIAYGIAVTPHRLARVERAESGVRSAAAAAGVALADVRVRDLGDRARLEVDAAVVHRVTSVPDIADAVRAAGFDTVEIDPRGFRSGSMNDALEAPAAQR